MFSFKNKIYFQIRIFINDYRGLLAQGRSTTFSTNTVYIAYHSTTFFSLPAEIKEDLETKTRRE
jgi:hypothetical protein